MSVPKRPKISLIGSGNIGGTLALLILQRQLGDVILFDVAEGIPQGKALDLSQSLGAEHKSGFCLGTNNPADLQDSDVVIVTAGIPRKPGMSRDDLLTINAGVIKTVGEHIVTYSPHAFVIVVTNPLDVMVWLMQQSTGLPPSHVVGMAGVLDSGRFTHFLAESMHVSPHDIQTFVLGGHGDSMVPLLRYTTVSGIPLTQWIEKGAITRETVNALIDRTRNGGAEIVNLLKTGSAFYAPAASALAMAESYILNQHRILPCAVHLTGEYGYKDVYAGVPAVIYNKGVSKVIELQLEPSEKENFDQSVESVRKLINDVKRLGL